MKAAMSNKVRDLVQNKGGTVTIARLQKSSTPGTVIKTEELSIKVARRITATKANAIKSKRSNQKSNIMKLPLRKLPLMACITLAILTGLSGVITDSNYLLVTSSIYTSTGIIIAYLEISREK